MGVAAKARTSRAFAQYGRKTTTALTARSRSSRRWLSRHRPDISIDIGWTADEWLADERGRSDFAAVMERMVESYGSDKNAKDISRVLRLPGFLHRKSKPHLVRILEASGRRYSRAEIIAAFPPVEPAKKAHAQCTWTPQHDDEPRIRAALYSINADDRDLWLQCGMAIKDHFGDSGRSLWDDWSRQSDKYNERDQDRTWKSFKRNGIGIGTLIYHAQQTGWRDERIHQSQESELNELGVARPPFLKVLTVLTVQGGAVFQNGQNPNRCPRDCRQSPPSILSSYLTRSLPG